jgi:hypothetical protein
VGRLDDAADQPPVLVVEDRRLSPSLTMRKGGGAPRRDQGPAREAPLVRKLVVAAAAGWRWRLVSSTAVVAARPASGVGHRSRCHRNRKRAHGEDDRSETSCPGHSFPLFLGLTTRLSNQ